MSDDYRLDFENDREAGPDEGSTDDRSEPGGIGGSIAGMPWRAGAVFGVGAFALSFAAFLHSAATTAATVTTQEQAPSAVVVAGLSMLANHGVPLDMPDGGSGPIAFGYGLTILTGYSLFLPTAVLVAAGYGLVRYVDGATVEDASKAVVTIVPAYLVLAVALSQLATYTVDSDVGGSEAAGEVVAASAVDAAVYAGLVVPLAFGLVGGLLAVWPAPIDRLLGERTDGEGDGRADENADASD